MATLVLQDGDGRIRAVELRPGLNRIGRGSYSELQIMRGVHSPDASAGRPVAASLPRLQRAVRGAARVFEASQMNAARNHAGGCNQYSESQFRRLTCQTGTQLSSGKQSFSSSLAQAKLPPALLSCVPHLSLFEMEFRTPTPKGEMLMVMIVLGFLWFTLINQLRVEWSVNAQYSYGWAVPFLCGLLFWGRIKARTRNPGGRTADVLNEAQTGTQPLDMEGGGRFERATVPMSAVARAALCCVLAALALLWLPVRLIQEANPEWRLVSWALALITIGITLILVRKAGFQLSAFSFPICFFLVAVPWPTLVEGPIIQLLTRANALITTELVNLLGIPAICHGNVIEVGSGVVGIDDACSGIRSFQATLMLGLFFGELYRLSLVGRLSLCLAGFGLALGFNLARTTLLTTVAARDGVDAISKWHDPAGITILVGCFVTLWLIGAVMGAESRKQKAGGTLNIQRQAERRGRGAET